MVTIKEVAIDAGVSVATVSRVLNSSDLVSRKTKEKVENSLARLNYTPNGIARTLFKKKSYSIGLIIPDISNPFFTEIARSVEDTAVKKGYRLILCNSDGNLEKEEDYVNTLSQNYVDGIILSSIYNTNKYKYDLPIVKLDRISKSDYPAVHVNNYAGGRLAAEILLNSGGKKFAEIRGPSNLITANQRSEGFQTYLNERNIKVKSIESDYTFSSATNASRKLLAKYTDVDSVFAGNDLIGISLIKELLSMNKKIPEEIQVLGFDGIKLGEFVSPSLSTIEQPIYKLGQEATELLINIVEESFVSNRIINMDIKYTKRETTK